MTEKITYGQEAIYTVPSAMRPWGMTITEPSLPREYLGEYVLVGVEQAGIELHHQMEVIDESGDPLPGVWVIFGYPAGGPEINLTPTRNFWPGSPVVLRGNAQRTPLTGYAQHTFQSGGEDIWVWDLDEEGALKLPSPIVKNCNWVPTPTGRFEHTGVKLTFHRRMVGVIPRQQRLDEIERRLAEIEAALSYGWSTSK